MNKVYLALLAIVGLLLYTINATTEGYTWFNPNSTVMDRHCSMKRLPNCAIMTADGKECVKCIFDNGTTFIDPNGSGPKNSPPFLLRDDKKGCYLASTSPKSVKIDPRNSSPSDSMRVINVTDGYNCPSGSTRYREIVRIPNPFGWEMHLPFTGCLATMDNLKKMIENNNNGLGLIDELPDTGYALIGRKYTGPHPFHYYGSAKYPGDPGYNIYDGNLLY